ncbi:hypothetical protein GC194_08890 [bacterium]|nr:hypothetical protein [bacterium]
MIAVIMMGLLASCYKDTRTCRCAREQKFNFENECRNVDDAIHPDNDIDIEYRVYEGVERYSPQYNPANSNEVIFNLVINGENKPAPHRVIANLVTGEHRFIEYIDETIRQLAFELSYDGRLLENLGTICTINHETCGTYPKLALSGTTWSPTDYRLLGWITQIFDASTKAWLRQKYDGYRLAILTYPELELKPLPILKDKSDLGSSVAWSAKNNVAVNVDNTLYFIDLNNNTEDVWLESSSGIGFYNQENSIIGCHLQWHPNAKDLYGCNGVDGIFKITIGEKKQYRIKKSCPNRQYGIFSISPLGDKIIVSRKDIKAERDGTYISENTKLVIMDIDGCNEEVLFEDWDGTVVGRP